MSRSRAMFFLLPFLLAGSSLSPAPAAASGFAPLWSLSGWDFLQDIGNADSDPQHELIFASKADGHLAIVDGWTGVIAKEFPEFTSTNTLLTTQSVDGDGEVELFFSRPPNGPVTALTTAYDWNGTTYATLFSHTDPVESFGLLKVRNATTYDAFELSSTDVRVRDLSGAVLLRASTAIPGWSGTGTTAALIDIDGDGIEELGIAESFFTPAMKVHFFNYAGGFVPAWTATGWFPAGAVNTDGDPQPEIIMQSGSDTHFALFDGLSGTMEQDFPGFKGSENAGLVAFDTDGDGISEVFLRRPDFPPTTRLFTAYKWAAGSYTTVFSHTDPQTDFSFVRLRSSSQYDLLERNSVAGGFGGDVRVRSLAGSLLFRASTAIPGWSGFDTRAAETDADHDGVLELAIQDGGTLRYVRYAGTFVQEWSTTAWTMMAELSGVDGDPQSEMVVASTADEHYALLDTPTGALEQEFPEFGPDKGYVLPINLGGNGRLELFFGRFTTTPHLYTAYDWTPTGYTTRFSHNDEIQGVAPGHFRNPGLTEIAELGVDDLRVRDASGVVFFRASTDLPGWTGVNRDMQALDVNDDGVYDMLAIDDVAVRMLQPTGLTAVADGGDGRGLTLLGSAPNPFRSATAIRFVTRAAGEVGIRVFDASGRLVRRLDDHRAAGMHEVRWDGRDDHGRAVPSGILFYEVTADEARATGRMVRLAH